ncbi:MAG: hypothetical protein K9M98_05415 [Cephaloticoccus sp.]|nr:hypothetical protein [Cephaloticoccus sp.]MCF7759922.1 hypothetical protein [Cephaloticoccus sp.]
MNTRCTFIFALVTTLAAPLWAWDYTGHRMVNELALAALPADFPQFVRTPAQAERIAFLSGEPDRWRNNSDLPIKQYNSLDHYLDIEQLPDAGIDPLQVPDLRYVFVTQFASGRAAHPENFPAIDPAKNSDHTREWPGLLPWAITEYYGKLKSAFSYLKTFEQAGTREEIANAQANVIYLMGVMGHYVGDGAQPLHTTVHHNGWVGNNPHGYTKWPGLHSWIDGGFIAKAGIDTAQLLPRVTPTQPLDLTMRPDGRNPVFVATVNYIAAQNDLVEPLYALEQAGKFKAENIGKTTEGREFITGQLLKGGEMLSAIWLTAWRNATEDSYLAGQLAKRSAADSQP